MNRRIVAASVAAALVGGVAVVVVPQHAASIVRLAAASVAVFTGGLVLAAVAPVATREPERTALDFAPAVGAPPLDPHGLRDARRDLDRPTAPGVLPAAVRERLLDVHVARSGRAADPPAALVRTAAPVTRDPSAVAALVHDVLDELDSSTARTGATDGHH